MKKGTKILIGVGVAVGVLALVNANAKNNAPKVNYINRVPFNQNAITVPPFGIYINNSELNNTQLLSHELVHWQQYQRMGLFSYYANYLKQHFANGYDGNAMEVEARKNESDYCKANYTECVRNGSALTVTNKNFRV